VLWGLCEFLASAVRTATNGVVARDTLRVCVPTLLDALDTLQRLPSEAVDAFVRTQTQLDPQLASAPAVTDVTLAATLMQPVVRHHCVMLGRYLPSTHASFVSERMLALHAHEEYMPRPLAEIKRELEAQRRGVSQRPSPAERRHPPSWIPKPSCERWC
jgi:hypothetical protein